MDRLKKLVEEQNKLWNRMQEIQRAAEEGEGRDWTADERTNWDAAEARLTEVSGDIERLERAAKLEVIDRGDVITATGDGTGGDGGGDGSGGNTTDQAKRYADAFWHYTRRGMTRMGNEQRELLEGGFSEIRAQGIAIDTAGGYLVPEGFRNTMTETMKAFGGLMRIANVIHTSTGNDLPWPTNDDTGNEGAILAENTQIGEQDITLGQRKLSAHTYTSKLVRVSIQLLQDSAFNLETWLPSKLGERIGRAVAGHLASGTGASQPEGLTTNVTVGKLGAVSATAVITYDDLIDLEHSVDPAYRDAGGCRYAFSDGTLKILRKLKDGDERPLWVPIPAPGFPSTINGWEYTIDNKLPVPAVSAKSILFGNFKAGYIIRQVTDVQMVRLTERYMDFLQVGFFGFSRVDAKPDDTAAIRAFQHGPAA